MKRISRIVPLAILLATVVWMSNATWYPGSRFAPENPWLEASWQGLRPVPAVLAALFAFVMGRWQLYAKSGFKRLPQDGWEGQRKFLFS